MTTTEQRQLTILAGIDEEANEPRPFTPAGMEHWQERMPSADKGYRFWLNKSPIRMYSGCALPDILSASDKGHMYECAQYLETNTNMLFHRVNDMHKPLTIKALAQRLRMSETRCYRFVKRMIELRIMAREDGRLYISPIYFFRGIRLRAHLFFLFETDLRSVLPQLVCDRFDGLR